MRQKQGFNKLYFKVSAVLLLVASGLYFLTTLAFSRRHSYFRGALFVIAAIVALLFVWSTVTRLYRWGAKKIASAKARSKEKKRLMGVQQREQEGDKRIDELITQFKELFRLDLEKRHVIVNNDYITGFSMVFEVCLVERQRRILSPWVLGRMREYAKTYQDAIDLENRLLLEGMEILDQKDRDAAAEVIKCQHDVVVAAKKNYYAAQTCIRDLGFSRAEPFYGITSHVQYLSESITNQFMKVAKRA